MLFIIRSISISFADRLFNFFQQGTFSSSREEEYPQGEVVGEKRIP